MNTYLIYTNYTYYLFNINVIMFDTSYGRLKWL